MYKNTQKGAATLIYLSLITLIAVLILTVSYSRMLLALKRGQSLSDNIVAGYTAESKVNDFLAILLGGYRTFDSYSFPLKYTVDGTTVDVEGEKTDDTETLWVTASRYLAVSKLKVVRVNKEESTATASKVEVALALDCTGSMQDPANPKDPDGRPTRFEELKRATLAFLDQIKADYPSGNFKVGVGVFRIDSKWLTTIDGKEMNPESELSIDTIRAEVERQLTDPRGLGDPARASACQSLFGNTSIGSGLLLANTYFRSHPAAADTKRVIILVSDGYPNSRIPYSNCGEPDGLCANSPTYCSRNPYGWSCIYSATDPQFRTKCQARAHEFVSCTLADTNTYWKTGQKGDRDPSVDAYGVLAYAGISSSSEIVKTLNLYAKKTYTTENATQLTEIFKSIFSEITSSFQTITIKREIPSD